jgi:membrane-associated protease RseP (regulator of RpoE activity)
VGEEDGDQDFKLVLGGEDAVEAIIEEVEEHLKKAGVLEKVIEKVRDILKHHRSGKRNYWYYPKDDGDKDANNKRRSHTIIEWHSDGAQLYRIGLNSSEVGASLRSHLGLDEGGLVIQSVLADSPADAAGLKTHDIIVKVDDAAVANQQALIEAVQVAGKDNQQLRLFIIRGGSPKTVKIKPRERNTVRLEVRNLPAAISVARPHVIHRIVGETNFTAPRRVRLHSVGPAYMIAKDAHNPSISIQSLRREIRELEKQVQGLQGAIKSLADHLPKD